MVSAHLMPRLSKLPVETRGVISLPVSARHPEWTLFLDIEQLDSLSCQLNRLRLVKSLAELQHSAEKIRIWAEHTERMSGLLEPLKLLEMDTQRPEALLRSREAIQADSRTKTFYEMKLSGDGVATLERIQTQPGTPRLAIPFTLTHESVQRCVDHLCTGL